MSVEIVYWENVCEQVRLLNPNLADICDQLSPDKKHRLYKIKYPYGATIVDSGNLCVPGVDGRIQHLHDSMLSMADKEALSYCNIPLALILNKQCEAFVESRSRVIPLNLMKPGNLFGLFEASNLLAGFHMDPIWNVTAGTRSIFMVPKISDKLGYGRIKKDLGIDINPPINLFNQFYTFKSIIDQAAKDSWCCEILVFSRDWIKPESKDSQWLSFNLYLLKSGWNQVRLLMDRTKFSLSCAAFSEVINEKCLKPRPYIVDTVKYLTSVAAGSGVAFKPASSEEALPLAFLQKVFVNNYQLKYIPTIMQADKLTNSQQGLYYSLSLPLTPESSPQARNAPSLIEDEREIRLLLSLYLQIVGENKLYSSIPPNTEYKFFHADLDAEGKILSANLLADYDERYKFNYAADPNLKICSNSTFYKGCISVSTKPFNLNAL